MNKEKPLISLITPCYNGGGGTLNHILKAYCLKHIQMFNIFLLMMVV